MISGSGKAEKQREIQRYLKFRLVGMDVLRVKHPGSCHLRIPLPRKTPDLYLTLLLLLDSVKLYACLMHRCPPVTTVCRFPNLTSEAGSPFFYQLPLPPSPGLTQHYQLLLVDGNGTLPHWMVFRQQTGSLTGLALPEDCGIYHLKVSVIGELKAMHFYLHVVNRTVTNKVLASVTSALTHPADDRKWPATRLTPRPHLKGTPLWTGAYRASRTDSESQPAVSSLGHIIDNQRPVKDVHAAKPTLHNPSSVSHLPLTEHYNDAALLHSRLKPIQSQPPSNKILSTRTFADVSPTSCLMTEQLSVTLRFDTLQHLSFILNQDATSQQSETTQGVSSTTLAVGLPEPGQTEVESSLPTFFLEPSVPAFTPALPPEFGFFSGQLETPNIINPEESLKGSTSTTPPLKIFSRSLPLDVPVSSLQKSPTYSYMAPKMSLSFAGTHQIISIPISVFNDPQLSVQSTPESTDFIQETLNTQLNSKSQQIDALSHTSFSFPHVFSETHPAPGPVFESRLVSEDDFDPFAPSAGQDLYTTPFTQQTQNLDPSFCGWSEAPDHGCSPKIESTYLESTVQSSLELLTSYSQGEETWTQFTMLDSSVRLFPTQTSNPTIHLSTSTSREVHRTTASQQMDISGALPSLNSSGISITSTSLAQSTSALSGDCVSIENSLFICQTDSSGPVTKGRPTLQILSTSFSPFHGTATTSLTSSQAGGPSSIQPTPPSASIASSMNLPPKVMQAIPMLMATVGFPFRYSIPPQTFLDPEDGEADTLSLEMRFIDGPPVSFGTWLALDALELHGVPLEVDLQFSPQHLLLAARDSQGLSAWLPLTLDLRRSTVEPCHVFTLTAQRSLYSILRRRRRVELLLGKLSHFFNSSSHRDISVVSMTPGSTVVSWYNYSLCAMGRSRVRQCQVDQIRSMWLAMRSADGSVNPAFKESMLPEFPITEVGPVIYRQDCFSTASTPTFDRSTPADYSTLTPSLETNTSLAPTSNTCLATPAVTATSQKQGNHDQWIAGVLTALFVVCSLILIVLLIATVLHFTKGRVRSRAVAIWPASRVLSLRGRDLKALRPRWPPLFRPEPPPPPLTLWIDFSQIDEGTSTCERGTKTVDRALWPRPPEYDF